MRSIIGDALHEAEENDPKTLKAQIQELKRELAKAKSEAKIEIREKPVLTDKDRELLIQLGEKLSLLTVPVVYSGQPDNLADLADFKPNWSAARPAVKYESPVKKQPSSGDLPKGEAAVLAACIQFPAGVSREQLTVLTAYKRSSRDAYIQRLREKGFVETDGGQVVATADGRAAMPDAEPLPTGKALQEYWLTRLPAGEKAILEALIKAYPHPTERRYLQELSGYKRSSLDAYVLRLTAKMLVSTPSRGVVRASDNLF